MKQISLGILIAACAITVTGGAASGAESQPRQTNPIVASASLPLQEARTIIDGAIAYARSLKLRIAVVQLGSAEIPVRARDATDEERNRLWPALTAVYEHFDAYQARTERRIPVVILSPV